MLLDKTLIEKKLNFLKHEINKIENMDITVEQVLEDEDIQDMIDRRMQNALESCIDVATHLAAGLQLPRQEYASDIFLLLGKNKVISQGMAKKFKSIVGFRNILVHNYADINYKLAYSNLSEKLQDLKQFAKEILEFLERTT